MPDLTERLRWGGVDVDTFAVSARDLSGLFAIPGRRGEDVAAAGRDGAVFTPFKPYEGREFSIEFLLDGCLADGTPGPDGQNRAYYLAADTLSALISQDVAPLDHQLPDGTWRTLPVQVVASVDGSRELHGGHGRVRVAFRSHLAWWRGLSAVTSTLTLAAGQTGTLSEFAASTGRIDDAVVTFAIGTTIGNNPRLTDVSTGIVTGYNRSFLAADGLAIGDYSPTATGFVFNRRDLVKDPRVGPWWVLSCGLPGVAPTVRLDLTGGGPMTVSVAARPSWGIG